MRDAHGSRMQYPYGGKDKVSISMMAVNVPQMEQRAFDKRRLF